MMAELEMQGLVHPGKMRANLQISRTNASRLERTDRLQAGVSNTMQNISCHTNTLQLLQNLKTFASVYNLLGNESIFINVASLLVHQLCSHMYIDPDCGHCFIQNTSRKLRLR